MLQWRLTRAGYPVGRVREDAHCLVVQRAANPGLLEFTTFLLPERKSGLGLLRIVATSAASEGIRKDTGIISWLRWPEQVTIGESVVAKTRLSERNDGPSGITLDFSVNCGAAPREGSISLFEALGVEVDRNLLRDKILNSLSWTYSEWERRMDRKLTERIRPTITTIGKLVEIRCGGRFVRGLASDITEEGSLVVKGRRRTVVAPDRIEHIAES